MPPTPYRSEAILPFIEYDTAGRLHIDGTSAAELASEYGTPLYIYSARALRENFARLRAAFAPVDPLLCYALKACGNLSVIRELADAGAGMDVVSGGELERAWLSGVPMSKVVFAGVGKSEREILAALDGRFSLIGADRAGRDGGPASERGCVGLFNIESQEECERIAMLAERVGVQAKGCLRVNPDVDAHTHKYTTTGKSENKFGIDIPHVAPLFRGFAGHPHLHLTGLHVHLGSPIATAGPYAEAIGVLSTLIDQLRDHGTPLTVLNIGGGYGVDYGKGAPQTPEEFASVLVPLLGPLVDRGMRIVMEPGRSIICHAGVLLSRVEYVKQGRTKRFIVCDAGMHTLIRPSLYQAYHFVWPANVRAEHAPRNMGENQPMPGLSACDVVGPICESSDFLAQNRALPDVAAGDLLAVFCAGAYGMSMASTYNDHPKPAEVMVEGGGGGAREIRPRGTEWDLIATELM